MPFAAIGSAVDLDRENLPRVVALKDVATRTEEGPASIRAIFRGVDGRVEFLAVRGADFVLSLSVLDGRTSAVEGTTVAGGGVRRARLTIAAFGVAPEPSLLTSCRLYPEAIDGARVYCVSLPGDGLAAKSPLRTGVSGALVVLAELNRSLDRAGNDLKVDTVIQELGREVVITVICAAG